MIRDTRNSRIDQLRGLSIFLVLLHHFDIAYKLSPTILGSLIGPDIVRAIVRNGNYGVTIFFVISGFLITSNATSRWPSLDRIETQVFYRLRAARILPNLLLLLLIVALLALVGLPLFQSRMPATMEPVSPIIVYGAALSFTTNVLVERLGWVNYPLGVLWSLAVEGVFYLTFPWVCRILKQPVVIASFWILIALIGPWYRSLYQGEEGAYLYAYFAAFDGIAIGCLAALIAARRSPPSKVLTWLAPLAGLGMFAIYLSAPISDSNIWGVTLIALGSAVLLLSWEQRTGQTRSRLQRALGFFQWSGRQSYELYLLHLVVLGLIRTWMPPKITEGNQVIFLLIIFLILSVAVASLTKLFYADPLDQRIRARYKGGSMDKSYAKLGDPTSVDHSSNF